MHACVGAAGARPAHRAAIDGAQPVATPELRRGLARAGAHPGDQLADTRRRRAHLLGQDDRADVGPPASATSVPVCRSDTSAPA